MPTIQKALLFIILPTIAILSYSPQTLAGGLPVILVIIALMILLGVVLWRGRSLALTFAIFVQGLNVIVRIMMFFSFSISKEGVVSYPDMAAMFLGIILSMYLLLRLDRTDVRLTMVK
ncbi:MAG: hypothetical protein HPY59_17125 [Anaerolineae bacterium]|nr:hypothetical protein [Anaerolineae bacterium]